MTLKTLQPEAFFWTWFLYVSLALHDLYEYQYVLQVAKYSWDFHSETLVWCDSHQPCWWPTREGRSACGSPDPSRPSRDLIWAIEDKLQTTMTIHYKRTQQMAIVTICHNSHVQTSRSSSLSSQTSTPSASLILELHYVLSLDFDGCTCRTLGAKIWRTLTKPDCAATPCWSSYISQVEFSGGTQRNLAALWSVALRCKVNQVSELNFESSDGFHLPIIIPGNCWIIGSLDHAGSLCPSPHISRSKGFIWAHDMYLYSKSLGFARNRNHDRQRILILILIILIIIIIIIIIIIKPLLKIFNDCRS